VTASHLLLWLEKLRRAKLGALDKRTGTSRIPAALDATKIALVDPPSGGRIAQSK
jgi:hypothetical protein